MTRAPETVDEPDVERRGPGRPPDLAKRESVLEAARELLAEVGYGSMTIDAVAKRACSNRVLIYRVWDTKLALAADAILGRTEELVVPDHGSLRADLIDFVDQHVDHMRRPAYVKGVPGLTVELLNDPDTTRTIWRRYVEPSDRGFATILARAVARGEVADHPDPGVLTRVVSGITTGLAQTGRMSQAQITDVILATFLGGLVTADAGAPVVAPAGPRRPDGLTA